ncbi:hypothetical protein JL722_1085 [Aureococcus anophagefferens]|nr:hypothetical protein JL722_1085 [Aureococcus anophagefferens]
MRAALLAALPYAAKTIVVDVADRSANSPLLKGYHFSPLNHQIYGVYSQMVYDESFEQSLSDLGGARSLGWSGDAAWVNDSAAFNGNVSVRLEPAARLSNRGLYHQGFKLEAGEPYEFYAFARGTCELTVALEDWGDVQATGAATRPATAATLATEDFTVSGDNWTRVDAFLKPTAGTTCGRAAVGAPPLDCGGETAEGNDGCRVCGGADAVVGPRVRRRLRLPPAGRLGPLRGLAGAQGRRRRPARLRRDVSALGRHLHRGGAAPRSAGDGWRLYAGPASERPPYTADHANVKPTKLRRWSRGWGAFEALDLCDAAGVGACAVALPHWTAPDALADFVEAVAASHDLKTVFVQIGNELCPEAFLRNSSLLGFGSADQRRRPREELADAAGPCDRVFFDFHSTPSFASDGPRNAADALDALAPAGCKVGLVVFEQNACRDGERCGAALDRAAAFNALAALGTRVTAAASSQLWTAGSHYDGCGEGHAVLLPDQVLLEPPYHAMRLSYVSHHGTRLAVGDAANLSVAASARQGGLFLRVANGLNATRPVAPVFANASAATCAAKATVLASPLAGGA